MFTKSTRLLQVFTPEQLLYKVFSLHACKSHINLFDAITEFESLLFDFQLVYFLFFRRVNLLIFDAKSITIDQLKLVNFVLQLLCIVNC